MVTRFTPWSEGDEARLRAVWPGPSREKLELEFPGFTYNAIRKKAARLGLPVRQEPSRAKVPAEPAAPGEEDFDPQAAIKRLESLGYSLVKQATITDHVFNLAGGRYGGELVRIGVVSDTHLCSRHQQLTHLKTIYRRFADEGVKIVLHAGDLVEGMRMFRGWELEVLCHGHDAQAEYAVANYPREDGITTYVIAGNHDASFKSNAGVDVVRRICDDRPDMSYLGTYGAHLTLPGGLRAYLHHGGPGGPSYARTYRVQKTIENFSPEAKPHLYIVGHYHVTATLPDYRNVFGMLPGCFQSQSEFLRRLGVGPDVGGWILEYRVNPETEHFDLTEFSARWLPFRRVIPNDY